jgi:hypothetical protein
LLSRWPALRLIWHEAPCPDCRRREQPELSSSSRMRKRGLHG